MYSHLQNINIIHLELHLINMSPTTEHLTHLINLLHKLFPLVRLPNCFLNSWNTARISAGKEAGELSILQQTISESIVKAAWWWWRLPEVILVGSTWGWGKRKGYEKREMECKQRWIKMDTVLFKSSQKGKQSQANLTETLFTGFIYFAQQHQAFCNHFLQVNTFSEVHHMWNSSFGNDFRFKRCRIWKRLLQYFYTSILWMKFK